jgi:hypothetical protein
MDQDLDTIGYINSAYMEKISSCILLTYLGDFYFSVPVSYPHQTPPPIKHNRDLAYE